MWPRSGEFPRARWRLNHEMKRILWIVGGLVVVTLGVMLALQYANRPSDREQIVLALDEAIRASREGQPGPVLDFISGRATLNEAGGASQRQIADTIRRAKPDVKFPNPNIQIDGDRAALSGPVNVTFRLLSFEQTARIKSAVVELEKEPATVWGIFPTHKWRVVKITTDEDVLRELSLP